MYKFKFYYILFSILKQKDFPIFVCVLYSLSLQLIDNLIFVFLVVKIM